MFVHYNKNIVFSQIGKNTIALWCTNLNEKCFMIA